MMIHQIRKAYLDFFASKQHAIIASASLVPENDATTLFTGSGMQPMVPYLLGEPHPLGVRIADSQTCFRSQDIEEVGDNRHTTFFEMLGNWSLGDYFKTEQLTWIFEFLTKELGLNPEQLYVTVFRGNDQVVRDTESVDLWKKLFASVGIEAKDVDFSERDGMNGGRIFYFDERKNWWSRSGIPEKMPIGEPGGPDSELFWDFGAERGFHETSAFSQEPCHVNCDCGRFLEIGNNVFMEYQKSANGFVPLPQRNVDFGGGLERFAAACANEPDVFKIDVFAKALAFLQERTGEVYGSNSDVTHAMRVVLDHLRAATFLMADEVVPSNKDRGYFVRRLIRRAVRFGKKLGMNGLFTKELAQIYIQVYQDEYPNLLNRSEVILSELQQEEERFLKTLAKGEGEFAKRFQSQGSISGEDAFILYSTYGFPIELSEEMAQEQGQQVERQVFLDEFKKHQDLSRAGSEQKFAGGLADHSDATVKLHTATHMLHQALRTVLGDHVQQKGSNITPERLRFDFSHPEKMTPEQIQKVEDLVNQKIEQNLPVQYKLLTLDEAKTQGAIGLFEETYAKLGDKIKVYFIGDTASDVYYSKEVCGGPHVDSTGSLGQFSIIKEESASNGIRRIKAILQ